MNFLLLFFALPVATILLAIVLQKILCSPILVAITFFAIYLIVTFAIFDETFLVFAIVYTILAYITAAIVRFLRRFFRCQNNNNCDDDDNDSCNNDSCNNCDNDLCNNNGGNNNNCNCEKICNCLRESSMFGSRGRRCGR
ncbi:MAG: DUF2651 family protein [Clostridia bacterium]|nr:DUF2651 family protein [Clostridia bacterium]